MGRRRKELVEAGLCLKGLHPWIDGQTRCRECVWEYNRKYRENNPDKEREHTRKWRENNPDKARESTRKWRERNPDRARAFANRRRARVAEVSVTTVTDREIERIYASPCAHAHLGDCDGPMHLDHIIPLSRGGRHAIGNLQPLCRFHNQSKRDRLEIEVKARARREVAA